MHAAKQYQVIRNDWNYRVIGQQCMLHSNTKWYEVIGTTEWLVSSAYCKAIPSDTGSNRMGKYWCRKQAAAEASLNNRVQLGSNISRARRNINHGRISTAINSIVRTHTLTICTGLHSNYIATSRTEATEILWGSPSATRRINNVILRKWILFLLLIYYTFDKCRLGLIKFSYQLEIQICNVRTFC